MVLPALAAVGILFFGGIFHGLLQSVGLAPLTGDAVFTLGNYRSLLFSRDFWISLSITLRIALLSTSISAALALFGLYSLFLIRIRSTRDRSIYFQRCFQVSMLFPYIVAAYMIFLMFTQSGWIARIFFNLGIISEMHSFPIITNESFGWGIILAYVWKTSPFIIILLYPVVLRVEYGWIEAARILGAGNWRIFLEILLPMMKGPLETASFIVFAYTFGAFEVPFILGITYPKTLAVYSYQIYSSGNLADQPMAMALNMVILGVILLAGTIYYHTIRVYNGRSDRP